jgi:hypothetical protein
VQGPNGQSQKERTEKWHQDAEDSSFHGFKRLLSRLAPLAGEARLLDTSLETLFNSIYRLVVLPDKRALGLANVAQHNMGAIAAMLKRCYVKKPECPLSLPKASHQSVGAF